MPPAFRRLAARMRPLALTGTTVILRRVSAGSLVSNNRRAAHRAVALACLAGVVGSTAVAARAANREPITGELFVHDPSTIVREGTNFYVFGTGWGIATKSSPDRLNWQRGEPVFQGRPAWTTNIVPGFRGYMWAPDVIYLNGAYHLYYSVSTFGRQVSAIGVATSPTLDRSSPRYQWTDGGAVIESRAGSPFNAIDPSVLLDGDRRLWMAFGSFWGGIYLVELDRTTGRRVAPTSPTHHLASHAAIEAACLYRRANDYYLFVNWGACCRGTNSTYEVRVGRSKNITGPYLDADGNDLASGGGTLFLGSEGRDIGPGHIGVFEERDRAWISYHVYDGADRGRSQLRIRRLSWTADRWPLAGESATRADGEVDRRPDRGGPRE